LSNSEISWDLIEDLANMSNPIWKLTSNELEFLEKLKF
jgi:hypothetical protein